MKFSQYGSEQGRKVIYFHGAPGAAAECALFDRYGQEHGLTFICFDRFAIDAALEGEAYYQYLAQEIACQISGEKVAVIGFSIGAFVALQTCRYMNGISSLHLISAAAPLEAGDFLDTMAGKTVFQLAKKLPTLFKLLAYWQSLLALLFPKALFRLLFASAVSADKTLTVDDQFQANMTQVLKSCFIGRVSGYVRDIRAYVQPWETTLAEISCNTYIWHGADDNWSPKAMAEYLKSAIPSCTHIEILDHLSHYSCLYEAAPKLCQLLDKS